MAKALIRFDFDVPDAARSLGIGQATLYNRLRREKFRRRREEFEPLAFQYLPETRLENLRRQVFSLAYEKNDERPYHTARQLKVSPGMFYRWIPKPGG
jgi:transcriptional regulator with PAS, ATPase and Fis domain